MNVYIDFKKFIFFYLSEKQLHLFYYLSVIKVSEQRIWKRIDWKRDFILKISIIVEILSLF